MPASIADYYAASNAHVVAAKKAALSPVIAPAQPATVLDGGQFGWRTAPDTGDREFHNGTDISTSEGTPVVASLEGTSVLLWNMYCG